MGKKIIITILVIISILGIGYIIARPKIPEWTVQFMVSQIQKDDYAIIFESEEFNRSEEEEFLLRKFLDTMSYEIIGSRIDGNLAFVAVELTLIDIEQFIIDNRQTIMRNAMGNIGGILGSMVVGVGMEEIIIHELATIFQEENVRIPLTMKEVEIPLQRAGLLWEPMIDEEWLDEVLGLNNLEITMESFLR